MTFRQRGPRDDPGPPRADQLRRRPRLRAVGRAGVPARAVRPDRGGRRAPRAAAVRDARPDVAPAREELRDVVPRVPPDLHAARGAASRATSSSITSSSGARRTRREMAAGGPERRLVAFVVEPDPDDPADVIGDEPIWHDGAVVGWVTSGGYLHHVEGVARARLRADRARDAGRARRARLRDRDHRATTTGAAPAEPLFDPPGPADAPVTDAPGPTRRRAGRIVVDGRPVRSSPATASRSRSCAPGEAPGHGGTLCLAGDCANCLAHGRWRRLRPDLPDALRARGSSSPATRPRASRRSPRSVRRTSSRRRRPARSRSSAAGRRRGHRRRHGRSRRGRRRARPARDVLVLDAECRRRGRGHLSGPGDRRPDADAGCSTSIRARSWSRPAPPRSTRSVPGNDLQALADRARRRAAHAAGIELGAGRGRRHAAGRRAVRAGRRRARPLRGRRDGRVRAVVTTDPTERRRDDDPVRHGRSSGWGWRRATSSRGWPGPCP